MSTEEDEAFQSQLEKATAGRQVIILLDKATLETVKTKKGDFQLLNCDDHINIMRKHNKDPAYFRPDIVHQVSPVF